MTEIIEIDVDASRFGEAAADPELASEGWTWIDGSQKDSLWWMHPPSQRTVLVEEGSLDGEPRVEPVVLDGRRCGEDWAGWRVICRVHDEHGNPVKGEWLPPSNFARAVQQARAIRKSILDEGRKDLSFDNQLAMFGEKER